MNEDRITVLKKLYEEKKIEIEHHIVDNFLTVFDLPDEQLLKNMLFCVCTPQTDAHKGWSAATNMISENIHLDPTEESISLIMRSSGVRFHRTKARSAMRMIQDFWPDTLAKIRSLINERDIITTRNHLAKVIKGWGLKEASHFLRNVGYGEHVAILDRHILRRLVDQNVIPEIPKVLDLKTYLEIEQKMLQFAKDSDIPMEVLDLLFWYQSKGEFFK